MLLHFNLRPVLFINGALLAILSAGMLVPALADALVADANWKVFAASSGVTMFIAVSLMIATRQDRGVLSPRQAFIMVFASWLATALFGALPFLFSDAVLTFSDAFFESTSGITTTGATVLTGLDGLSPGLLLWRGMLQWLGGIGLIVMAIFVLPELRVGGMQFFRPEGGGHSEASSPRVVSLASRIFAIYAGITVIGMVVLLLLGLRPLDAIVHAMTSVATGGFSNYDRSIAEFESAAVEVVLMVLMVAGALPFLHILRALLGHREALFRDPQVRWMLRVLVASVLAVTAWLVATSDFGVLEALRAASFNTVSMMTGTGYSTAAYDGWGAFPAVLLLLLMLTGGCVGSSTSGLKVFRVQVLLASLRTQLRRLSLPRAVLFARYAGRPVDEGVQLSVLVFFCLYLFTVAAAAVIFSLMGMDLISSVSGAVSAVANIGPGYGEIIGPTGNYAPLSDGLKWVFALTMILGRLELYAVLVLFSPSFWRD
ncbi:MAG: TrkH family potassium uptake protein [Alphaproteobacteria bacterium]|nr:TrkH family potassium uptake protein [Alphaproteobacteria bacterium]MDA7982934.1 TrkH family potassium uptake protein [Alphaproteobacteria bacterium]MDA7984850.1 TrkH family potassium uptake protein [Alphaproteobacteria bacterium]MDA7987698.1 TrkH family potassium uptake protein [Alphaproteobacteria bacterium]MDA7989265.1 TrkH family potassium uptake protein [Alphaproteobacteria bacterium]